jgi:hypothetical protein
MAAIAVILLVVAAGFAVAVAFTIVVIIGVRQEERNLTLTHRTAPGAMAQLARIALGRYVRQEHDELMEPPYPDDPAGARERSISSRG